MRSRRVLSLDPFLSPCFSLSPSHHFNPISFSLLFFFLSSDFASPETALISLALSFHSLFLFSCSVFISQLYLWLSSGRVVFLIIWSYRGASVNPQWTEWTRSLRAVRNPRGSQDHHDNVCKPKPNHTDI